MNNFISAAYLIFVKSIDKGILEFLGPLGLTSFFRGASIRVSGFQSGLIYHYAFVFLLGLLFMLSIAAINVSWIYVFEPALLVVVPFVVLVLVVFG